MPKIIMVNIPLLHGERFAVVENNQEYFLTTVGKSEYSSDFVGSIARDFNWREVEVSEEGKERTIRSIEDELVKAVQNACEKFGTTRLTKHRSRNPEQDLQIPGVTFKELKGASVEDDDDFHFKEEEIMHSQ